MALGVVLPRCACAGPRCRPARRGLAHLCRRLPRGAACNGPRCRPRRGCACAGPRCRPARGPGCACAAPQRRRPRGAACNGPRCRPRRGCACAGPRCRPARRPGCACAAPPRHRPRGAASSAPRRLPWSPASLPPTCRPSFWVGAVRSGGSSFTSCILPPARRVACRRADTNAVRCTTCEAGPEVLLRSGYRGSDQPTSGAWSAGRAFGKLPAWTSQPPSVTRAAGSACRSPACIPTMTGSCGGRSTDAATCARRFSSRRRSPSSLGRARRARRCP